MNFKAFNILIIVLLIAACASPRKVSEPTIVATTTAVNTPPPKSQLILLKHKYYEVHYDPEYRLAKFVKYRITSAQLKASKVKRKNRFLADPILKKLNIPLIDKKEYAHTNYDKGHLAPSADFAFDQEANDETFYMSNMAPQSPNLNRGSWKILEERVRRYACGEGEITVITGPILEKGLKRLKNGMVIPNQFFKIVIDETPPKKAIAYLYNQTDKGDVTDQRVVPLRSIEQRVHEKFGAETYEPLRQPSGKTAPTENEWKEKAC